MRGERAGTVGIDEAGKGDYFGPLVIAACFTNNKIESSLAAIGLRESKKVTDKRVFALESGIKKITQFAIVAIGPEKYNELHKKMRNLNRMLAWGHARALENILAKVNPVDVVADQFGDKKLIENALMTRGSEIRLIQRTKAESVPAVAAASILARAEFLRRLKSLSERYSAELPKGAGEQVDKAAREFARLLGKEKLGEVAKIHFKNTSRILGAIN